MTALKRNSTILPCSRIILLHVSAVLEMATCRGFSGSPSRAKPRNWTSDAKDQWGLPNIIEEFQMFRTRDSSLKRDTEEPVILPALLMCLLVVAHSVVQAGCLRGSSLTTLCPSFSHLYNKVGGYELVYLQNFSAASEHQCSRWRCWTGLGVTERKNLCFLCLPRASPPQPVQDPSGALCLASLLESHFGAQIQWQQMLGFVYLISRPHALQPFLSLPYFYL